MGERFHSYGNGVWKWEDDEFNEADVKDVFVDICPASEEYDEPELGFVTVLLNNGKTYSLDGWPYETAAEAAELNDDLQMWRRCLLGDSAERTLQSNKNQKEVYGIQAKNTFYDNVAFRSRTEAKLAVAFDGWCWRWEYEPERFVGFDGATSYLPDFYLPDFGVYVEVKGTDEQLFASQEKISNAIDFSSTPVSNGLILMGSLPSASGKNELFIKLKGSYLYWNKGIELGHFYITCDAAGVHLILDQDCTDFNSYPELPSRASVNIAVEEDYSRPGCRYLYNGLYMARMARFDFDDSLQKALSENRRVIGGNL